MTDVQGRVMLLMADATPAIGAGHVMRLTSLADAWRLAGGRVRIAGQVALGFVQERLREAGVEPARPDDPEPDVLVVDTYDATIRYRAACAGATRVKMLVDDVGGDVPPGFSLVWNPAPFATPALYPGFGGRFVGGRDAVPVRASLGRWSPVAGGETIVTLGGGRAPGAMTDALIAVGHIAPGHRFAIAGDWAPPGWRLIPSGQLWREARTAARLVTAAGTTVWEAAAFGIPVIVLQLHENQRLVYRWARDAGVPGLNALLVDAEFLAHQLGALLEVARPLPELVNGSPKVAEILMAELERVAVR